ncbi:MAG TPA: hypothetical protein VFT12_07805, partial [Thermoanaerobaculia bacterium]|nr:hypothetical protein [Thermoanaerobaculia bacterium]
MNKICQTGTSVGVTALLAVPWLLFACSALGQSAAAGLDYGPHAVGFRFVTEIDHSRTLGPRTAFDGTIVQGE